MQKLEYLNFCHQEQSLHYGKLHCKTQNIFKHLIKQFNDKIFDFRICMNSLFVHNNSDLDQIVHIIF